MERPCNSRLVADLALQREAFLPQCPRSAVVAAFVRDASHIMEDEGDVLFDAELPQQSQALLKECRRSVIVAVLHGDSRQLEERCGDAPRVVDLSPEDQTLLIELDSPDEFALILG